MSKVSIKREDKNRVLLTEILPYEVPMLFSNDGFYKIVSSGDFNYFKERINNLRSKKAFSLPFDYSLRKKSGEDSRVLSIIHPIHQLDFIDLYDKYNALIIHQCSKSPFSLRKISKIAKFCCTADSVFDEDSSKAPGVEVVPDDLSHESMVLRSYFTYQPIDLIYKFFEGIDFRKLEQKYNYMLELDISKCFYNIYTHSISWAVKGKEYAKNNIGKISFENAFDKYMQSANFNETNGIVVGPEVSRIFAEIILQRVDIDIYTNLEKLNYKLGVDYEIKRYVDDYFVFANDKVLIDKINKKISESLSCYKLYLNDSKTQVSTTPFITNVTVAKFEIKNCSLQFFNSIIDKRDDSDEMVSLINKQYGASGRFILNFRCIVKNNNLDYSDVCKEVIHWSKSFIRKLFKNRDKIKDDDMRKTLLEILDICGYAYSMSITASTTFKYAQIIVMICKYLNDKSSYIKHSIYTKINKDVEFALTIFHRKSSSKQASIETLNIVIAIRTIFEFYPLSNKRLSSLFHLDADDDNCYDSLSYFHIITLMYYIKNDNEYDELKSKILASVERRLDRRNDPFMKSELTMLFFDIISCPYISDNAVKSNNYKKKIVTLSGYSNAAKSMDSVAKIKAHTHWFMDWDENIDLEAVLKKKEWASTY